MNEIATTIKDNLRMMVDDVRRISQLKDGEEVVLAWQFAGESSGPLPQWRCLRLANVRDARTRAGPWHEGGSHKTEQRCVNDIDLDINIHVRKLR